VTGQIVGRNVALAKHHFRPPHVFDEQRRRIRADRIGEMGEMVVGVLQAFLAADGSVPQRQFGPFAELPVDQRGGNHCLLPAQ
jgi:hypothetical protein